MWQKKVIKSIKKIIFQGITLDKFHVVIMEFYMVEQKREVHNFEVQKKRYIQTSFW